MTAACLTTIAAIVMSHQVALTAPEGAQDMPRNPRLEVKVGETRIIMRGANYPYLFRFPDGSVVLRADTGGGAAAQIRSADGGARWAPCPDILKKDQDGSMGRLADGTVLTMGQRTVPAEGQPGTYVGDQWVSTDNGATFTGPDPVYVHTPPIPVGYGDGGTEESNKLRGPIFHGDFIALDSGDLLATMYTNFEEDTKYPKTGLMYKFRSILVKSTDRGKHWSYVSTIASMDALGVKDPQVLAQWQDGFDEPTLALLPDGSLVCAMRTGTYVDETGPTDTYHDLTCTVIKDDGKYYTTGRQPCKPLYMAISTDTGATWSTPTPMETARGACPRLILLSNGVLALSYGRLARPTQGDSIIFSSDGGRTWTNEVAIYRGLSSGYTTMVETAPGRILYVFDAVTAWGPKYTPDWIGAVDIRVRLK